MSEQIVNYGVWVPVIAALSGVVVAGFLSLISNFLLMWWQRRSETKSLRVALGAEIYSIITVIKARHYESAINLIIENMKKNNIPKHSFHVKVANNYAPIFNANTGKIGLLKPGEASFIVGFHQLIMSIVQDVTPGGVIFKGADVIAFSELSAMLESAVEIGESICEHIKLPRTID